MKFHRIIISLFISCLFSSCDAMKPFTLIRDSLTLHSRLFNPLEASSFLRVNQRVNHETMRSRLAYDSHKKEFYAGKFGITPLHVASVQGDIRSINEYCTLNFVVKGTCKNGWTALHYAILGGQSSAAKLLIDKKAHIDEKNELGCTPLHIAASRGYPDLCKLLLDAKADVKVRDSERDTPLHHATSMGHLGVCELLSEYGADLRAPGKFNLSPLHLASFYGREKVVAWLLQKCDSTRSSRWDCYVGPYENDEYATPLHLAILNGHISICKQLLKAGVDPSEPVWGKGSSHKWWEMVNDLRSYHTFLFDFMGKEPLHMAIALGEIEIAQLLLDVGQDLEKGPDMYFEWTPLMFAVYHGQYDMAKMLLERGAQVNAKCDYKELVQDSKGNTSTIFGSGRTALHLAAENNSGGLCELLASQPGVEIDAKDDQGNTPLSLAARKGLSYTSSVLICHGANIWDDSLSKDEKLMLLKERDEMGQRN